MSTPNLPPPAPLPQSHFCAKIQSKMGKDKSKKTIIERLNKMCACCGKQVKVILYKDRSYRSGHYFGKIPIYNKEKLDFENTKKVEINGIILDVLQNTPKPQKHEEYWECPKCYWN